MVEDIAKNKRNLKSALKEGDIINNCTFIKHEGYRVDPNTNKKASIGKFRCHCGKEFITRIASIKSGNATSCGCYGRKRHLEVFIKHGLRKHPLYNAWYAMIKRCTDKDYYAYKDYGNRGITVCDEWKNNFIEFYEWSINNGWKKGLQIDRIDNNKGYSSDNCKYSNSIEQGRNRRNNVLVPFNGENICLMEYCEINNVRYVPLVKRIRDLGWDVERALSTPIGPYKRKI